MNDVRNPTMLRSRRLATALLGTVVLLTSAGCAEMPPLPQDPVAAEAVVRKMLLDETTMLFKASGVKFDSAEFDVRQSDERPHDSYGEIYIMLFLCTREQLDSMTDVIRSHGWLQSSSSGRVDAHKGALNLTWANDSSTLCGFRMTTMTVSQHLPDIEGIDEVPELAAFKARVRPLSEILTPRRPR